MKYTQEIIDYYSEEIEGLSIKGKTKEEIREIVNDISDIDKEFYNLYSWLKDNGEYKDAKEFYSLFNYGVKDSLTNNQVKLLKKYSFHIFSQIHLALELDLK